MTELFGNMTTKQAGLLGTRAVFQSQWGIVTCVPMSLDNTPSLLCNHISHISCLIILSGLSFLPIRLAAFSSQHIITSPSFRQARHVQREELNQMRPVIRWGITLCCLICSITRTHIYDLNICIQISVICTHYTSVRFMCVCV